MGCPFPDSTRHTHRPGAPDAQQLARRPHGQPCRRFDTHGSCRAAVVGIHLPARRLCAAPVRRSPHRATTRHEMSRPTRAAQFEQAEGWMLNTFGRRMGNYLRESRQEPIGLAVVEVDRVLKASGARRLLTQWRAEDVKSAAGRKPILDSAAALSLILLQIRLGRPTMITEMAQTTLQLSPTQAEGSQPHPRWPGRTRLRTHLGGHPAPHSPRRRIPRPSRQGPHRTRVPRGHCQA